MTVFTAEELEFLKTIHASVSSSCNSMCVYSANGIPLTYSLPGSYNIEINIQFYDELWRNAAYVETLQRIMEKYPYYNWYFETNYIKTDVSSYIPNIVNETEPAYKIEDILNAE